MDHQKEDAFIAREYSLLYDAAISCALLGNISTPEYDEDAKKIIALYAKAYGISKDETVFLQDLIVDELIALATTRDANAFSQYPPEDIDHLAAYYVKSEAVYALSRLVKSEDALKNNLRFNYSAYIPYYPALRRDELAKASARGYIVFNRTVALLEELGIGGEKDHRSALIRLRQCAYWGDGSAMKLLALLAEKEEAARYEKLYGLRPLLDRGVVSLDEKSREGLDQATVELFAEVARIRQCVILDLGVSHIDYSLVEALLYPDVDHLRKLSFIKYYRSRSWKEVTNPSANPRTSRLGFRRKEN